MHPLGQGWAHILIVVDDSGHGCHRNTGMGSYIFDRRWAASRLSHIVHLLCFLHWKRRILSVWRLLFRRTHKTFCRVVEVLFEDGAALPLTRSLRTPCIRTRAFC